MKKTKLLNKLRTVPKRNARGGGQLVSALDIPSHGMNQSTQLSKLQKTNSTSNGWECPRLATDSPASKKSFKEIHPGNSLSVWPRKTLNLHPATAELEEIVDVAATTCAGIQQQSTKSNATTQEKHKWETHNQSAKARMQQHFNKVRKFVKLGEKSDSCAKHFATQSHDANPSPANQREGITCIIIWQRNPISAVKTFATKNCALHAKERIAILKQSRSNPQLLVNSIGNNKINGTCGHRLRFHRCAKQTAPSADESINDERASPPCEIATGFDGCNVCTADVWLEALWGPTKRNCFLLVSRALALETIPTICCESVILCCQAGIEWERVRCWALFVLKLEHHSPQLFSSNMWHDHDQFSLLSGRLHVVAVAQSFFEDLCLWFRDTMRTMSNTTIIQPQKPFINSTCQPKSEITMSEFALDHDCSTHPIVHHACFWAHHFACILWQCATFWCVTSVCSLIFEFCASVSHIIFCGVFVHWFTKCQFLAHVDLWLFWTSFASWFPCSHGQKLSFRPTCATIFEPVKLFVFQMRANNFWHLLNCSHCIINWQVHNTHDHGAPFFVVWPLFICFDCVRILAHWMDVQTLLSWRKISKWIVNRSTPSSQVTDPILHFGPETSDTSEREISSLKEDAGYNCSNCCSLSHFKPAKLATEIWKQLTTERWSVRFPLGSSSITNFCRAYYTFI